MPEHSDTVWQRLDDISNPFTSSTMPHVNLTSRIGTFLPLRCLVFISHVILFCSLWHLRARHALHLLITIVGFTILAALLASLIPRKGTWCTRPSLYSHPLRFSCDGVFAGLNAALPILASPYFFPQKKWLASLYSTMILLAGFNWAEPVLDLLGLVVGITVAATFFIFVPQPAYLEDDGGALPSPVGAFPASPVAGPEPCGREQEQETTPVPAILPKSPEPVANGVAEPVVEPAVDDVTDKVRKRASMSWVPLPKGPRRQRTSPGRSGTAQTPPPPPTIEPEAPQASHTNPPPPQNPLPQETRRHLPSPPRPLSSPSPRPTTVKPTFLERFPGDAYEKLEIIGQSATQMVHKVRHRENGRVYAMKTIVPREKPAHELVQGFEDFIRLTKPSGEGRGRGLNLVRCYEAYVDYEKDEAKVVMEFCEGGSLHTVRQRIAEGGGIVGEGVVGKLAIGILDGLSFLHEQGIIHRGITPFNVLLTKHGVVKLSEVLVSPTPPWGWDKFSISCLYISPERILGNKPITGPSDVWSMGITLLEFLWHRHPYPDLPSLDLMARIVNGEPPQLKNEEGVRRSPQMKDFFKQLLIVDAASRPDARALKQHPWVVTSMRREVNMKRWIADVWGWPRV